MSSHPKRAVAFLWSTVAAALIALGAPPAHAGRPGRRIRRHTVQQQAPKRHAKAAAHAKPKAHSR